MKNYFSIELLKRIIIKKEFQMLVANGITMASNRKPFSGAQFGLSKYIELIHIKALAVSSRLLLTQDTKPTKIIWLKSHILRNSIDFKFYITYRNSKIRIIGTGYWRKGKQIYEKENKIHR